MLCIRPAIQFAAGARIEPMLYLPMFQAGKVYGLGVCEKKAPMGGPADSLGRKLEKLKAPIKLTALRMMGNHRVSAPLKQEGRIG